MTIKWLFFGPWDSVYHSLIHGWWWLFWILALVLLSDTCIWKDRP